MLAVERRNQIEKIITENKSVLVVELAKQFDVTTETIRGDLEKLEKQGVLIRTYGGATLAEPAEPEMNISERDVINYEGKQRIGKTAAKLIKDGDTIFLDSSTSALHLARHIKSKVGITVITNAGKIVTELAGCDRIRVICVGGNLEPKNMSFVGRVANESIRENYFADKCFFSCRGLSESKGLADSNEYEADVKKAMLDHCNYSVFLCDHKKIGRLGVPTLGGLDRVDCMITDRQLNEAWTERVNENEVKVIIAE